MTIYRQALLSCDGHQQVAWLDTTKKWGEGSRVKLKNDDRLWRIEYVTIMSLKRDEIKQDWHAGGLRDKEMYRKFL